MMNRTPSEAGGSFSLLASHFIEQSRQFERRACSAIGATVNGMLFDYLFTPRTPQELTETTSLSEEHFNATRNDLRTGRKVAACALSASATVGLLYL